MKKYLILIIAAFLTSCGTVHYVPVETVKTEYKDVFHRDSIFIQDSVFLKIKGDTVWLERYKTIYKDKLIRDSIFIRDSVQVPYPVKVEVAKKGGFRNWHVVLMCIGAAVIGYFVCRIRKVLPL